MDEAHHFGLGICDEALETSIAPQRLALTATPPSEPALSRMAVPIIRYKTRIDVRSVLAMILSADAQRAAERGVNCYLASMFVMPADFASDSARLAGYAQQHSMNVVFSNYGGPSGGLSSTGRSAIWSAQGQLLAQLEACASSIATATLWNFPGA